MWRTMSGLQSNLCYCSWMWRRSLSHLALLPTSLHVLDCNQHQWPVWEGEWLNIHAVQVRCTQNPNSKTALKPTPVSIWKIVPNPLPVNTAKSGLNRSWLGGSSFKLGPLPPPSLTQYARKPQNWCGAQLWDQMLWTNHDTTNMP